MAWAYVLGAVAGQVLFIAGFVLSLASNAGAPAFSWLRMFGTRNWLILGTIVLVIILFSGRTLRHAHDRHQSRGIDRNWLIRESRWRKSARRAWVLLGVAAVVFAGAGAMALNDLNFVLLMLGGSLSFAGVPVAAAGWFGRKGARLVCARCNYPMISWKGATTVCPECGNDWQAPWGARFGVRAVRWRIVGVGVGMVIMSAAVLVALLARR